MNFVFFLTMIAQPEGTHSSLVFGITAAVLFVIFFLLRISTEHSKTLSAIAFSLGVVSSIAAIYTPIFSIPGPTAGVINTPSVETSTSSSKVLYRYRSKIYTEATTPELNGWILYDTISTYSSWSEWTPWQYEHVDGNELREVKTELHYASRQFTDTTGYGSWGEWTTTRESNLQSLEEECREVTFYGYYYFECPNCHAHMHGWDIICPTWAGGCGQAYIPNDSYHEVYSTTPWDSAGLMDWHGTGKLYTNCILGDGICFRWDGVITTELQYRYRDIYTLRNYTEWSKYSNTVIEQTDNNDVSIVTAYSYRERSKETTYYFYRWGDWSSWTDKEIQATDDVEVERFVTPS